MEETKEQLTRILEAYNIGKKPLSKLLGWGETTVLNQLKGAAPEREFAAKIREIYEDPLAYSEILEANKAKITEVAYKKSRKALDAILCGNKSSNIVRFLASSVNGDTAPYQLVAALFYAQAACLILYGRPLIDEDIVYLKRNYMPYPEVYAGLLKNGVCAGKSASAQLTQEEGNLVTAIFRLLSGYSPNAVKTLLKDDRAELIRRHTEGNDVIRISLSEFQEYCEEEKAKIPVTDIRGVRKYFDEKLKKSRKQNDH